MRILAIATAAILGASPALAQKPEPLSTCDEDVGRYLQLDLDTFDQKPESWRTLSKAGCDRQAAELIAAYRSAHGSEATEILLQHEAQLRAAIGEVETAITLLREDVRIEEKRSSGVQTVNILYTKAEIAFLSGDRSTLVALRAQLAAMPEPKNFDAGVKAFQGTLPGVKGPSWPPNLDVVDGLIRCFGQPYRVAYGAACLTE